MAQRSQSRASHCSACPGDDGQSHLPTQPIFLLTKLTPPPARPDSLLRPHLLQQIEQGMAQKLTCICAPAGFGKTTLLSTWTRQSSCPVAWLALDKRDNNLQRFWSYVIAALATLHEGCGEDALSLLYAPQPPAFEVILTTLLNTLTAIPGPFAFVLDDYHTISQPAIHEAFAFFLDHLPPHMHLLIASREYSMLPLASLRASGQLCELSTSDLAFTPNETTLFMQKTMKIDVSAPEDIAALQTYTEGWAAGLQLTALALRKLDKLTICALTLHGDHRYLVDYLIHEVFAQQPADLQTFLLHTALCERLTASLCDALTGNNDGLAMLHHLELINLFLIPLDERRQWYRYHTLFQNALRRYLRQTYPDLVPLLYQRATLWCEQNNLIHEAVDYALASADFEYAASLIARVSRGLAKNGETTTLARWLDQLPDELRPDLSTRSPAHGALSSREIELIRCLAVGLSNDEIAQRLVITRGTVQWHLKNIYGKLYVHNRTQAVAKATELGLANWNERLAALDPSRQ